MGREGFCAKITGKPYGRHMAAAENGSSALNLSCVILLMQNKCHDLTAWWHFPFQLHFVSRCLQEQANSLPSYAKSMCSVPQVGAGKGEGM